MRYYAEMALYAFIAGGGAAIAAWDQPHQTKWVLGISIAVATAIKAKMSPGKSEKDV